MEPVEADRFKIRLRNLQQLGHTQQGGDIPGPHGQFQPLQEITAQGSQAIIRPRFRDRGRTAETIKGGTAPPRPPQGPARQSAPGSDPPHRHPVGQRQRHGMPAVLIQRAGIQSWKTTGHTGVWGERWHGKGSRLREIGLNTYHGGWRKARIRQGDTPLRKTCLGLAGRSRDSTRAPFWLPVPCAGADTAGLRFGG